MFCFGIILEPLSSLPKSSVLWLPIRVVYESMRFEFVKTSVGNGFMLVFVMKVMVASLCYKGEKGRVIA